MKPADLGHRMEIYFSLKLEFIGESAAGASPLHPTKNLFEKRFLELPKPL